MASLHLKKGLWWGFWASFKPISFPQQQCWQQSEGEKVFAGVFIRKKKVKEKRKKTNIIIYILSEQFVKIVIIKSLFSFKGFNLRSCFTFSSFLPHHQFDPGPVFQGVDSAPAIHSRQNVRGSKRFKTWAQDGAYAKDSLVVWKLLSLKLFTL